MKKIISCFAFLTAISISGYSQSCCYYHNNGNVTCEFPKALSQCLNDMPAERYAAYILTPCIVNGMHACPAPAITTICCVGSSCIPGLTQQQCNASFNGPVWYPMGDCRFCSLFSKVELSTFSAVYSEANGAVALQWEKGPLSNTGIYIQRSRNGTDFKTIGYLDANPANEPVFKFTDINPFEINYYRLLGSANGQQTYSQILIVIAVNGKQLKLVPNPAIAKVRVMLSNMQLYDTEVVVLDLSGRTVYTQSLRKGQHEIDVSSLHKGMYIIKARQSERLYTAKFIKN